MAKIGSYDVIETLGDGPHGLAHLAVEPVLGRTVVIKPMDSLAGLDADLDTSLAETFAITSPWVARPLGTGRHEGRPYIVREYVNGLDLGRLRAASRPFDLPFAVGILAGATRGIAALHAARFAHGNLRLSNIFVTRTGELRVADPAVFARVAEPDAGALASGRWGALTMLPPERLDGGAPALADDLFALGALGFWLLADGWPFEAADPIRLAAEIRTGKPGGRSSAPVREGARRPALPTSVPVALTELITTCLAPTPGGRPGSAADIVRALDAIAASLDFDTEDALMDGLKGMSLAFMTAREPKGSPTRSAEVLPPATLRGAPKGPTPEGPVASFAVELTPEPIVAAPAPAAAPRAFVPPPALRASAVAVAPEAAAHSRRPAADGRTRTLPTLGGEPPMLDVKGPDTGEAAGKSGPSWAPGLIALALVGGMVWYGLRPKTTPDAPAAQAAGPADAPKPESTPSLDAARAAAAGGPDEALRTALVAVRELPASGEAQLLLAKAYARKDRPAEAAAAAMLAAERLPDSIDAQRTAVSLLLLAGRTADAASVATTATGRHASDAGLQLMRGQALRADRRLDEASEALGLAVDLDGEREEAWAEKGEVDLERGRFQPARDAFLRAIGLDPKLGRAYAGLGRALVGLGRGGEGVDTLKRGLDVATDPNAVRFALGWVLLRDGRNEEALGPLQKHAADNPTDARSHLGLGVALLRTGHMKEAAAALKKSVALDESVAEAHYDLAVAELGLGNADAAVLAFGKATVARFGFWPAHCERGRLLYRLGRRQEGRGGLGTALQIQPGLAVAEALIASADDTTTSELLAGIPCGPTTWLPEL